MSMERLGVGQSQLHHRQQAVPAGDEPGLRSVALQQLEGVVDARRPLVFDRCRYLHGPPFFVSVHSTIALGPDMGQRAHKGTLILFSR